MISGRVTGQVRLTHFYDFRGKCHARVSLTAPLLGATTPLLGTTTLLLGATTLLLGIPEGGDPLPFGRVCVGWVPVPIGRLVVVVVVMLPPGWVEAVPVVEEVVVVPGWLVIELVIELVVVAVVVVVVGWLVNGGITIVVV